LSTGASANVVTGAQHEKDKSFKRGEIHFELGQDGLGPEKSKRSNGRCKKESGFIDIMLHSHLIVESAHKIKCCLSRSLVCCESIACTEAMQDGVSCEASSSAALRGISASRPFHPEKGGGLEFKSAY
jgi:hypothetical protein